MAKRMARMAARQLIRMLLLIFCASLAAFVLLSLSPIDPLQQNVGQAAMGSMSAEQIERLQAYWGVDTPPLERFAAWVGGMLRGDFGISLLYRQPVLTVIGGKAGEFSLTAGAGLGDFRFVGLRAGRTGRCDAGPLAG